MQNFGLTDSRFKYVKWEHTDIRETFRRLGFVGPEQRRREAQPWTDPTTGSRKS